MDLYPFKKSQNANFPPQKAKIDIFELASCSECSRLYVK